MRVRHAVFVVEQGVDPAVEHDAADAAAIHVLCRDPTGHPIGAGRLVDAGDHARLGRIAVLPPARGGGAGVAVVRALERAAGRMGLTRAVLHSQQTAVGFYERLGYAVFGPVDVEAGIEHRWMARDLIDGLRRVQDGDGPALESLIGGIWSTYPGVLLDVDAEEPWLRQPATAYAANGGEFWVAGVPLVACVGARPTPDPSVVELKSLYVDAQQRGKGLGERLVGLVERWARGKGADSVELWSDVLFADGHRLYERLGYHATGQTRALRDLSHTVERQFWRSIR